MHLNSKLLFGKFARPLINAGTTVLEIGPDQLPSTYQLSCAGFREWATADLYARPGLTYQFTSDHRMPVADDSYDIVLSGQVLEHVRKPWEWIAELVRVCKPGGHVITIAPVSWPYHEAPIDCWRVYPEGMRALLEGLPVEILTNQFLSMETSLERQFLIPGRSQSDQGRKQRLAARLLGRLGVPFECAFDLICIARKL